VGLGGGRLAGSAETLHHVNYEIHPDFLILNLMIGHLCDHSLASCARNIVDLPIS
jgi:hypothetical protein